MRSTIASAVDAESIAYAKQAAEGEDDQAATEKVAKSPMATFYTRGFDGFVASTAPPIATGWSDQLPGGNCTH